jgi:spore coat polysaccharide biosynthesis predicted glycosyltransferase SpsG
MSALMVCHAGEGIGLGHLSRCLVAAQALRQQLGVPVDFLIQGDPLQRQDLAQFAHAFIPASQALGAAILERVRALQPRVLLLDLHPQRLPVDLGLVLERLRALCVRVVAIDGLLSWREQLDLVFLPSLRCDDPQAEGPGAPVVFGLDCLLIGPARRSELWQPGSQVLVLTGGADATGLGAAWPALLDAELPARTQVHWVQGPYARAPSLASCHRLSWTLHQAPAGLHTHMACASYALTVYGVSFFELLKWGVPTVVFSPYGSKDQADLQRIQATGLALVADDERDALVKMRRLMTDPALALALSARASEALAGSGADRLCAWLAPWCMAAAS